MQIVIRYTSKFGKSTDGIEIINVPVLNDYDQTRATFKCLEDNHWALVIEHWVLDKKTLKYKWQHDSVHETLLRSDTECSAREYRDWLWKYIRYVEIDGRDFWTNPKLNN